MAEVQLKWFHTFLFLFQAILSVADTTTDILTCLTYRSQGNEQWFAVSLGVTLISLTVLCIWSIIASTSRVWTEERDDVEVANPDVIFRSTRINVLLGCLCVGPPLHSVQLFLFCACRFKELWKSNGGLRSEKDRLYYLYVHTLNLKMVEGLLESAPQLIIQVYVMLMRHQQGENIEIIQMISAPISFLSLVWMFTSMEILREFENYNMQFLHDILIFLSNAGMIAARSLAIVFFTLAFPWWLFLVFGSHWLLINVTGFWLWRSRRKQDMLVFIFAYSPLYLFVYSTYYLKKLRGSVPLSLEVQNIAAISWHVLFTVENIGMISLYYARFENHFAFAVVLVGNIVGIFLKCCCPAKHRDNESFRIRIGTIVLTSNPSR